MSYPRRRGGGLMLLAGIIGAVIAAYDFVTPATGIDHSGGVELVLISSLLMALGAIPVLVFRTGLIAGIFAFLIFLDILGTGTAAYFLESWLLMGAMAIAAIGWVMWMTGRSERTSP